MAYADPVLAKKMPRVGWEKRSQPGDNSQIQGIEAPFVQTENDDNSNNTKVIIHSANVPVCRMTECFRGTLFRSRDVLNDICETSFDFPF